MVHPIVDQLRFARSEFRRGLDAVSAEDALRRFLPMNSIGWNVGHLAWQEQRYWLTLAQGRTVSSAIAEQFANGGPPSTPGLTDVLASWEAITRQADPWLDAVTAETLASNVVIAGKSSTRTFGTLLLRVIYHYWYHTGENAAIRQNLGHTNLPEFVGDIDAEAPYRADA